METRGSVKGILQDESGKPVQDAIVMIVDGPSDFNDIASVSNEKGEFYISNVVIPGRYVLQIQGNDQQKRKEVNLSSTDSVIKITY
ncbi:MAG: carboxypeptidase-like regulatory domain-containing protein [Chitinophagaceae bacterium]|nr:carboxypeptidase-like regulatory domain-containing protein [Chitinophagaceae bacterium]